MALTGKAEAVLLRLSAVHLREIRDMAPELSRQVIGPLARFYAGQQPPAALPSRSSP